MSTSQEVAPSEPSLVRAWVHLVMLSWQRQARARQMVWIALGLLAFAAAMTAVGTASDLWHAPRFRQRSAQFQLALDGIQPGTTGQACADAILMAARAVVSTDEFAFLNFSRWVIFSVFLSFLLPIWTLSFATEAIGGEREAGNLIWLLSRPLPRPAVYLAKFVALLPWTVGLTVGGFGLLCLLGGKPGATAFRLYWPAVLCSTLAFASLFHLLGACFRRPAVLAIGYCFFLEIILGNMPGYMKRVSISFYTHCMMYEAAQSYGVQPEKPSVYLPVDGTTAMVVLLTAAAGLVGLGMVVFSRRQYQDGV